mgnify:CR=1 FL=1
MYHTELVLSAFSPFIHPMLLMLLLFAAVRLDAASFIICVTESVRQLRLSSRSANKQELRVRNVPLRVWEAYGFAMPFFLFKGF